MSEERFETMSQAVLDGDVDGATAAVRGALQAGAAALQIIERGLVPGIRRAGELWEEGEYFLPELVMAAEAMKAAMAVVQPELDGAEGAGSRGRVVIGTVQGDIHDIGKTLVGTLLSASGFEVSDEGADVPIARLVDRAREIDADFICASALLTTTMVGQKELVGAARDGGLRARVLVGGAPVTRSWAEEIGAAGYADSAVGAVELATRLLSNEPA